MRESSLLSEITDAVAPIATIALYRERRLPLAVMGWAVVLNLGVHFIAFYMTDALGTGGDHGSV